ncbi:MAG: response regulator [Alphaproteobacteria bacterium]
MLIVEDSVLDMKLFRDLFGARGYAVLEATNGSEALDLARRCRPDLILVDVDLVRESGLEVVRRIKADAAIASAPMIAVSVFLGAGDRARLRDCGCENWFAKPVPVSGLIAVCDRLCPPRDDATAARS